MLSEYAHALVPSPYQHLHTRPRLYSLTEAIILKRDDEIDIGPRNEEMNEDIEAMVKHNALQRNLLTLAILVQNRRKDGKKALVFPVRTQALS